MPPKRPPKPLKKIAAVAKPKFKFTLNAVQRVQVEIIDSKRRSIRCLLIIAHVTLIHLLVYLTILGYGFHLIQKSEWLQVAFYGFFIDIGLYFFGSGAALKAITFSWLPIRFLCGIISVILGIILNIALFFLGTFKASSFDNRLLPLPYPNCTKGSPDMEHVCLEVGPVTTALFMMPFILPPVSLVCVILASIFAYSAVYVIPNKLEKGEVDAVWLEPYETYDFYVGRNIPRIPGYDDDIHFNTPIAVHYQDYDLEDDDDDQDTEDTDIIDMISGGGAGGGKKRKRPLAPKNVHEDQNQARAAQDGGGQGAKKNAGNPHHLHKVHHTTAHHHEMKQPAEGDHSHPPPVEVENKKKHSE